MVPAGGEIKLRLVDNDTTTQLLADWESVRERIAAGNTRAFALVEVKKDMSFATMWARPEDSWIVGNMLVAAVAVLSARLVNETL